MEKLEEYLSKCRCCLIELPGVKFAIDEATKQLFFELTFVELVISPLYSSFICQECSSSFKTINRFKSSLTASLYFLSSLDPKTTAKLEAEVKDEVIIYEEVQKIETIEPAMKLKAKKNRANVDFSDNKCPICLKQFTEKRKIRLHIKRIHEKIRDFHCDRCDYSAHTNFEIVLHRKNVHDPNRDISRRAEMRICPECGKSVRGNNALTMHIRKKHLNIKKFQCDHCPFASYGKYEMKSHLVHVHVPKEFKDSFPCSQCSSVLSSAMGLKVHLRHKHSGLKPYSCFCGKSYSLNETLKMHIRNVHYGERRFVCQLCPKRFGQAVRLRDHINNDHGTKQEIPCSRCDKVFPSSRNLQAHQIYHDEPKFKCDDCGKKFFLSNKLKEHLKTHQGTEYQCTSCTRTFQLVSSLSRHAKKHHKPPF